MEDLKNDMDVGRHYSMHSSSQEPWQFKNVWVTEWMCTLYLEVNFRLKQYSKISVCFPWKG